jgi:hypothetical protein
VVCMACIGACSDADAVIVAFARSKLESSARAHPLRLIVCEQTASMEAQQQAMQLQGWQAQMARMQPQQQQSQPPAAPPAPNTATQVDLKQLQLLQQENSILASRLAQSQMAHRQQQQMAQVSDKQGR